MNNEYFMHMSNYYSVRYSMEGFPLIYGDIFLFWLLGNI